MKIVTLGYVYVRILEMDLKPLVADRSRVTLNRGASTARGLVGVIYLRTKNIQTAPPNVISIAI